MIEPREAAEGPDAITRKCLAVLEKEITAAPGYWNWMYKRWKFIPAGEAREHHPYYARPLDAGRATALPATPSSGLGEESG